MLYIDSLGGFYFLKYIKLIFIVIFNRECMHNKQMKRSANFDKGFKWPRFLVIILNTVLFPSPRSMISFIPVIFVIIFFFNILKIYILNFIYNHSVLCKYNHWYTCGF